MYIYIKRNVILQHFFFYWFFLLTPRECHVPYLYVIRVHEREYMYVYLHVYITRLG